MRLRIWKGYAAATLALLCLVPLCTVRAEETGEAAINAASAAALLRAAGQTTPDAGLLEYDLTGNGVVDAADAEAMLLHTVGRMDDLTMLPEILTDSLLGERYLDKFSYNGTVRDGADYRSERVSVTVRTVQTEYDERIVTYHIADIYLRNLACLRTAFANDTFKNIAPVETMAREKQAIIAISGDFFGARKRGLVIRNGEAYRRSVATNRDVAVLYSDGVLETYLAKHIDLEAIEARAPYQSWGFGPALLDENGQPKTKFNTAVAANNPRSAIGYYEPGHYCFVVVDGRMKEYSYGISMKNLSTLFYELGCTVAYNLDGGATAVMANADGMLNRQSDRNRECSDIIYIIDTAERLPETAGEAETEG